MTVKESPLSDVIQDGLQVDEAIVANPFDSTNAGRQAVNHTVILIKDKPKSANTHFAFKYPLIFAIMLFGRHGNSLQLQAFVGSTFSSF